MIARIYDQFNQTVVLALTSKESTTKAMKDRRHLSLMQIMKSYISLDHVSRME